MWSDNFPLSHASINIWGISNRKVCPLNCRACSALSFGYTWGVQRPLCVCAQQNQSSVRSVFHSNCTSLTELVQNFKNIFPDTSPSWDVVFDNPGFCQPRYEFPAHAALKKDARWLLRRALVLFQCQVLSARSLRLSPVTAGHQLTAPACQTCHSAKIKTAEKALPSGKPEIPSRRVRAVTVSGNDIIVSPWRDAWGLYRCASMDVANPCWRQSRAVPVVCVGSAVLPQPVLLPRPANGLRRQSTLSL